MRILLLAALLGVLASACYAGSSDPAVVAFDRTTPGPTMRAGDNCLACHGEGKNGSSVKWGLGGTVYPARMSDIDSGVGGATLVITDATGKVVRATANSVGNFWSAEKVMAPLQVQIEQDGRVRKMPIPAPAGSCNACHSKEPLGGAEGAIVPP